MRRVATSANMAGLKQVASKRQLDGGQADVSGSGMDADYGHHSYLRLGSCVSLFSLDNAGFLSAEGFASLRVYITGHEDPEAPGPRLRSLSSPRAGDGGIGPKLAKASFVQGTEDFRRSVFRLMPAQSYENISAYREMLERHGLAASQSPDSPAAQARAAELERLRTSANLEQKQNADTVRKLLGTEVMYGQAVQLLHLRSGKYLTARSRRLSVTEKECTLLELDVDGDEYSLFNLLPRYKHRRYGFFCSCVVLQFRG